MLVRSGVSLDLRFLETFLPKFVVVPESVVNQGRRLSKKFFVDIPLPIAVTVARPQIFITVSVDAEKHTENAHRVTIQLDAVGATA